MAADNRLLPKTEKYEAVHYMLNEWDALMNIFTRGDYHLDNNLVERLNRYISLSRRNSLFFGSHTGAKRAAMFYSLACSCRLQGINFFEYISDVINKAAALPPRTPLSKYRELLPDKWKQKNIAQEFEYANVSIPVAILIWLMIYPMMLKVDFQSVKNVGKRPREIIVTCVTNWLIKPFTMFGIAYLFFYVIFKTNKLNKICICCY